MKLTVTSEFHCVADEDEIWSVDRGTYAYFARFLDVFDQVEVFCRVESRTRSNVMEKVTGDRVKVIAVRDFNDPRSFFRVAAEARSIARKAASNDGAFLLHAPGTMASLLGSELRRQGRSFGIEVVGDPKESLAGSTVSSKAVAILAGHQMRQLCQAATTSRYVTERALQLLYPPVPGSLSFVASDVEIPDAVFFGPVPATRAGPILDLGFVGMLHRPYKGLDVLLKALCQTQFPHRLKVLGDGSLRGDLEAWSKTHSLADRVTFLGTVPMGEQVRAFLLSRDLIVQPSRTEGIPRALIEAMAVGLPCLATSVGGIPELLDKDALVPTQNVGALARAIDALAVDSNARRTQAKRNRVTAQRFALSATEEVHQTFREAIRATNSNRDRFRN
jgi:phosphatidyl-myo-inositol dimannoside synthase